MKTTFTPGHYRRRMAGVLARRLLTRLVRELTARGMACSDDFTERRPYNAVSDFVDANMARGLGDKDRLHRSRPLAHLWRIAHAPSVRQFAARAWARARGSRVALLLHDTVDYPVAFWGAIRAGIVAIPLNTFLNAHNTPICSPTAAPPRSWLPGACADDLARSSSSFPICSTVFLVGASADDMAAFPGRMTCICSRTSSRRR